ncbi:MAG: hypothetical protein RLZZ427_1652, partial [Pseudomonadota bacterium]
AIIGAIADLVDASGCDAAPLLLAQHQKFDEYGDFAIAARCQPTVGAALQYLTLNQHKRGNGYVSALEIEGELAVLRVRSMLTDVRLQRVQMSFALGLAIVILRSLAGADWSPDQIELATARDGSAREWSALAGCVVLFDREGWNISFARRDLSQPIDDPVRAVPTGITIKPHVDMQLRQLVDREIVRQLSMGRASLDGVAATLGLSARALQRRLEKLGSSYQTQLDAVRSQWAQQYLLDPLLPITAVTHLLGFSDPATFCRSFVRWQGISPRAWRKANLPH